MWTRASLTRHLADGHAVDFFLFYGHTPKVEGAIDRSCLSQWYPAAFEVDGVRYATAEHFMMAEKARLFRDDEALGRILEAATPSEAKRIGRSVRNYDDQAWGRARTHAVVKGNVAKFDQDTALRELLRSTGAAILVEASPRDRIWGIGMGASNPDATNPARWRGQNLLGFALTEARAQLFGASR
ncbi:MAG: NADAR family protein [Labilithrix sp.]|nr:NADAR family protein [Labilithrix sp.]MCW5818056.1 NADAR family protein [Labilithrix sp.]